MTVADVKMGRRTTDSETCPMSVQDVIDMHKKLAIIEGDLSYIKPLVEALHANSLRAEGRDAQIKNNNPLKWALGGVSVLLVGTNWESAQPIIMKILSLIQ